MQIERMKTMFMQRSPRQQAKRPSVMKKLSALFSFFRVEAQSANGIELIRNFIAFLTAELSGQKFSSASCAANYFLCFHALILLQPLFLCKPKKRAAKIHLYSK